MEFELNHTRGIDPRPLFTPHIVFFKLLYYSVGLLSLKPLSTVGNFIKRATDWTASITTVQSVIALKIIKPIAHFTAIRLTQSVDIRRDRFSRQLSHDDDRH